MSGFLRASRLQPHSKLLYPLNYTFPIGKIDVLRIHMLLGNSDLVLPCPWKLLLRFTWHKKKGPMNWLPLAQTCFYGLGDALYYQRQETFYSSKSRNVEKKLSLQCLTDSTGNFTVFITSWYEIIQAGLKRIYFHKDKHLTHSIRIKHFFHQNNYFFFFLPEAEIE